MLEILEQIITILTGDATLNAIIPAANIFTGPVDVVNEQQSTLLYPQIQITVISESTRSIPTGVRDTMIQVSIFSRNNQLEVINAYERILTLLEYYSVVIGGTAVLFWSKVSGCSDMNMQDGDRRTWHRAATIQTWAAKPQPH